MSFISALFGDPFDSPRDAIDRLLEPNTHRREVSLNLMATALRRAGYTVIRSSFAPVPRVGQCWQPTRGRGKGVREPKLAPRWVRSVGEQQMSYASTQSGWPVTIDRASWDAWVRKTRARCV